MTKKNYSLTAGLIIEIIFFCIVIMSFFYTPQNPFDMNAVQKLKAPSLEHFFGTDNLGRDIFSRTIIALRYSLLFSISSLVISSLFGCTLGLFSAVAPRIIQMAIMRVLDAISSIPTALLALVLLSVFQRGTFPLILSMAIVFFPSFVRITRNETVKLRELEYIQSVRAQGAGMVRILFVHILPNIISPLVSSAVIVLTNSIMIESILSYLGLGIQPPTPSLGRMMFESQSFLTTAPWGALFPGAAIVLLAAGFHYLGEGLLRERAK